MPRPVPCQFKYAGRGTLESPYLVEFLPNDARNPLTFAPPFKWTISLISAVSTLAVSFTSSAYYSASVFEINKEFHASTEVAILGVSMFVLGLAIGPLFWAPFSELYGRQKLFFITYMALTALAFNAAGAASPSCRWLPRRGCELEVGSGIDSHFHFHRHAMDHPIPRGSRNLRTRSAATERPTERRAEALSRRTGKDYISKLDAATPRTTIVVDGSRYTRMAAKHGGVAPP